MNSYLSLIIRNTRRNGKRSTLTIASLTVSLCLVGVLLALSRVLFYGTDTTPGQAKRIIVHHKVALTQELPIAYEQQIRRIPGVQAVTGLRWFGGTYKDVRDPKNRFGQFAIEPQTFFAVHPELRMSQAETKDFVSQKTACIASRKLATQLGWKDGDKITLVGGMIPVTLELTLAGIFDAPAGEDVLYFNQDYLQDSLHPGDSRRNMVQQFYVEASSKDAVNNIARQIDALFAESPYPTKSEPEQAFMLSFVSFLGNVKLFLVAICGAVAFTILLISMNMLSMSVRERTREIGVLKTIGFSSAEIMTMVVGEATLIAGCGGVLGCALAAGLCAAIANALRGAPGFAVLLRGISLTPVIALLTLMFALLLGAMGSIVPGLYASRTSIVDALRYEG